MNWDDLTWKYAAYPPKEQKEKWTMPVRCLLCGFLSTGKIHLVKVHIDQVKPSGGRLGVKECPKASMEIWLKILDVLTNKI